MRARGEATGREFILLVTALMATTALGIDLMLPAFPEIREQFGMAPDSTQVTWIITAYFLGMAAGPWLYGPASDRFGRRIPLYAGLTLYAVAAVTAALAPSWELIVVSRFVWGIGSAGPRSLSVAMIRDRYEGDAMARLMSMIMAVFLLVPIAAPGVGAGLIAFLPWRAVFWFPAAVAVLLMFWARRLPETLTPDRRRPFTWRSVGAAGREPMVVDVGSLMGGNRSVSGVFLGAEIGTDRVHDNVQRLINDAAKGELEVVIDRVFPLSEAAAAHAYIESRAAVGRVVMVP